MKLHRDFLAEAFRELEGIGEPVMVDNFDIRNLLVGVWRAVALLLLAPFTPLLILYAIGKDVRNKTHRDGQP